MPILFDKRCRFEPTPEDGVRVLIMRYWPCGVRRDRFDVWLRQLAPSAELLKWCKLERWNSGSGKELPDVAGLVSWGDDRTAAVD